MARLAHLAIVAWTARVPWIANLASWLTAACPIPVVKVVRHSRQNQSVNPLPIVVYAMTPMQSGVILMHPSILALWVMLAAQAAYVNPFQIAMRDSRQMGPLIAAARPKLAVPFGPMQILRAVI